MNYDEAIAWLYATQLHGIKLGLDNIRRLVPALGIRASGPGTPQFLHVAGTNGKGSVCAMIDAIVRAAGGRCGLFTSPHLLTFRERVRVNGGMITEEQVARGLDEIRALTEGWDPAPTFFEIATALALAHFQRTGCEVAVLETGMGGRLDATNVVTPAVSVITPIALDHEQWLGSAVEQIAGEKAGIFKRGVPAVSAPQADEVTRELRRCAREMGARTLEFVEKPWSASPVNLAGSHQQWNAAVAVRALAVAAFPADAAAIAGGLHRVQWPGRFQQLDGRTVLDGAHNPAAALRLCQTWREIFGDAQATLVFGVLADKDLRAICAALLPLAARVIAVPVRSPRSCSVESIVQVASSLDPAIRCRAAADLESAFGEAFSHPERVLVCGSLFLVGEAMAHFEARGGRWEESAQ